MTSDYIGWVIGLVGIGISIGIYKKQTKTEGKVDRIRKNVTSGSFQVIYDHLKTAKMFVNRDIGVIEQSTKPDAEKYSQIHGTAIAMNPFYTEVSEKIEEELNSIKTIIDPSSYYPIHDIIEKIRIFQSPPYSGPEGFHSMINQWMKFGNSLVNDMDKIMPKIENELARPQKKKNYFRAKGYVD